MKNPDIKTINKEFEEFILGNDHPCIMAQTVFTQSNMSIHRYKNFGSTLAASGILGDIKDYLETYDFENNDLLTFIAVFDAENIKNELTFELLLWKQLQEISDLDNKDWDDKVSPDPEDDEFSFSIMGHSFYIVGMHPKSSRIARQSPYPCLVFNLHSQFESLRKMNVYNQIRTRIRTRDKKLQGSTNPMLADFGHGSEAKQYSGREVGDYWKCPFNHNAQ